MMQAWITLGYLPSPARDRDRFFAIEAARADFACDLVTASGRERPDARRAANDGPEATRTG